MTAAATQVHHLKLLAALRRVKKQFGLWDELDIMALMPPTPRPDVEFPMLDREQLKSLQVEMELRFDRG